MHTGRFERDLEGTAGRTGSFNVVAFSSDGGTVFGAGSYLNATGTVEIRRWPLLRGAATDIPVAKDLVTGLLPNGNGVAFTTAEPMLGFVGADGRADVAQYAAYRFPRSSENVDQAVPLRCRHPSSEHGSHLAIDVSTRAFLHSGDAT